MFAGHPTVYRRVMDDFARSPADVVIVGAGPVGLSAALLLDAQGVRSVVLERQPSPSASPKAISLDDSSMRLYQRAGVDDQIASIIVPGTGTAYYASDGKLLFHARGPGVLAQGHPFKNPFAQPDLERILQSCVHAATHATLRRGAEVEGVASAAGGVRVSYRHDGALHEVFGRFVIGADGGQSTVRRSVAIAMEGRSYDEPWLVVDATDDHHDQRYGMHHGDPDRPFVIVPGLHGRCRYEFKLTPEEGGLGGTPEFALIRRLLQPFRPIEPHQVERAVVYRFHALVAQQFQREAVFLVGDAAHMMPPFAGQGLNSGLRDVGNLTWKLADVLNGRLPASILDSYEGERRAHVEATVAQSVLLGDTVMTTSQHLAVERDRRIREALTSDSFRNYLERMEYRPSVELHTGLLVPGPKVVGTQLKQPVGFSLDNHGVRRLDDVLGPGWAVIGVDVDIDSWATAMQASKPLDARPVSIVTVDRNPTFAHSVRRVVDFDGSLTKVFGEHEGTFMLVRPDRYVAAAWPSSAPEQAEVAVGALRRSGHAAAQSTIRSSPTTTKRCPI